jgi:hypothetical protein
MTQPFPPAKFLTMHPTSNFHGYEFLYTVRNGERGRNRTCDPRLKRALLYQLSYAPSPFYFQYLTNIAPLPALHKIEITQLQVVPIFNDTLKSTLGIDG